LAWAVHARHWNDGVRMASALADLWHLRDAEDEARECFESLAAAMPKDADANLRWATYDGAARFNIRLGHLEAANRCVEREREVAEQLGPVALAWACGRDGVIRFFSGDLEEALQLGEQAMELFAAADHPELGEFIHNLVGICHLELGNLDRAEHFLRLALRYAEAANDLLLMLYPCTNIGECYGRHGDRAMSEKYITRAVEIARDIGTAKPIALALCFHADIGVKFGDLPAARADLIETLETVRGAQEPELMINVLQGAARYFCKAGRLREALMAYGLADRWRHRTDVVDAPYTSGQTHDDLERLRSSLDPQTFEEYWKVGHTLSADDIHELLREVTPAHG
jgi:tetratricopeptide (TPR) repeat protein